MSEFDEWFPRHSLTGSGVQLYSKSDLETVWQACQATSAARIAELVAEVKALDSSFDSCNAENDSLRMINSNMALRIAELEADCKVMAKIVINNHEDTCMECPAIGCNKGLNIGKPFIRDCCICPACLIAAKYREGK